MTTLNRPYALCMLAALAAAPLAYAHVDDTPYGLPKPYCEDATGDQAVHDYGPPASGLALGPALDGSIPAFDGHSCAYDDLIVDRWDGHLEWGAGGAWLLACGSGCGRGGAGSGSIGCFGTYADHLPFPDVWVFDHVLSALGADVAFGVYVDRVNGGFPNSPECGDFEFDLGVDCVNHCSPNFGPGLDGSYQVLVFGTAGHVWTNP